MAAVLLAGLGAALARLQLPAAVASGLAAITAAVAGLLTIRGTATLKEYGEDRRSRLRSIRLVKRGRLPLVRELDDPIDLGVHPAALIEHEGRATRIPDFVSRDVMPQLKQALQAGGFVLLVGESTAGKSRVAYEAMRERLAKHKLIEPIARDAAQAAADMAAETESSVLWLDDLERFLGSGGLTSQSIRRVLDAPGQQRVILATMRAEEYARYSERTESGLPSLGRETERQGWDVLRLAKRLDVPRRWSVAELGRAASHGDQRVQDALQHADRFGLAEYLAAGPQLMIDWRDAWSPGTHPRGAAIVLAATDARRVGIHRPLPLSLLIQLHELYLESRGGILLRPESLDAALTWASTPLHATSSLLLPGVDQTYLAFDYLIDAVENVPVPPAALELLISTATPDEAMDLGRAAWWWRLYDQALAAFHVADEHGHPKAAGSICDLLFETGSDDKAVTFARHCLTGRRQRFGAEHELTLDAHHLVAYAVGRAGDTRKAVKLYQDLHLDALGVLGPNHELTRDTRLRLAQFTSAWDVQKAARMYTELADEWARTLGKGDRDTVRARDQAARCIQEAGDAELAVRLHTELLDDVIRFGADDDRLDHTRYMLAWAKTAAGQFEEALAIWRQLVASENATRGAFSSGSLEIRRQLAECAGLAGDPTLAVSILEEAMTDALRFTTVKDLSALRCARDLAHWVGKAGDPYEAVQRLQQQLETAAEWLGSNNAWTLSIRWRLADCIGDAGDVTRAVNELEELVAEATAAAGPEAAVTRSARGCLDRWRQQTEGPAPAAG